MKNLLFILIFFISLQLVAQESDNSYVMYQTILLKAKPGHGQELRAGLKAHNDKYHQEGTQRVNVWSINSGKGMGSLLWVKGPLTWTDMDTPMTGNNHMAHWREFVAPHADMESMEYWRLANGMSYMPEGFSPKMFQARYFDIKTEKGNNARHLFGTIFKVYKEMNIDIGLQVYTNQVNEQDGRDWAIFWLHDSWASLDKDRGFVAKYEEMHGDDSWDEFFEGWREAATMTGMQIFVLQEELSVGTRAVSNE